MPWMKSESFSLARFVLPQRLKESATNTLLTKRQLAIEMEEEGAGEEEEVAASSRDFLFVSTEQTYTHVSILGHTHVEIAYYL
jgi:hypothetical protein